MSSSAARGPRKDWLDFKAIKKAARFETVLEHYGIEVTRRGDELTASCPFHEDAKPSFKVNTAKGVFNCFGCGAKGNVLEFVQRKEGGLTIRQAAQLVAELSGLETGRGEKKAAPKPEAKEPPAEEPKENKPLTISLQLDQEHGYLTGRGLVPETVATFGIGYSKRGMMRGRIAIPIHNEAGELVAYAGRWAGEGEPPEKEGKYKLPPKFRKSLVLYNLHRVARDAKIAIVVEGYFSVFWLSQCGFSNVVSIMGTTMSERQRELLSERVKGVMLFLDGDEPGRAAADTLASFLARDLWVKAVVCPDGKEPDELLEGDLRQLLA